ncbi:hypothetical protein SAMN05421692_2969 [Chryseobacterium indologenes]|nr:hypothetical protein SAMN05421692_2969 [Chryseobacterium indologenes]
MLSNNRIMTGTLKIPETIHQIKTTSDRESFLFKKKAGLLTCNIFYLLPMPRTVDLL